MEKEILHIKVQKILLSLLITIIKIFMGKLSFFLFLIKKFAYFRVYYYSTDRKLSVPIFVS